MAEVFNTMKERYSVRGYKPESITKEELETVILAGLHAPTATNRQEIHFSVVDGSNPILKELEDLKNAQRNVVDPPFNFYYNAPTVIFISAETEFYWSKVDAGIAVENMALAATELGLGSLIIGCVKDALHSEKKDYFAKALGIPEGYQFEIALAIGYKDAVKEPHTFDAKKQVTYI